MDLIYSDVNFDDVAVLKDYSIDFAFGEDENNFELVVDIEDDVMGQGYFIYYEGTGYGGIVDEKKVDTEKKEVTYCGRTFEGILENTIVVPASGDGYYVASGDANAVIRGLITACNLTNVFTVESASAGINIANYKIRYNNLYSVLVDMLYDVNYKLEIKVVADSDNNNIIQLSAVPLVRHSESTEWFSDTVKVQIDQIKRQVNHLICLGSGELANRHVIHIFCDEKGTVQSYTTSSVPVKDADYILDQSKKVLADQDEITEIYDYSNAGNVDNYLILNEKPSDWDDYTTQSQYSVKDDSDYKDLEPVSVTKYALLDAEPYDWTNQYSNYFQVVDDEFQQVALQTRYVLTTSQPSNWSTNYGDYFWYADGTKLSSVPGASQDAYIVQVHQPPDWSTSFGNYYEINAYGNYVAVEAQTYSTTTKVTSLNESYRYSSGTLYSTVDAALGFTSGSALTDAYYTSQTIGWLVSLGCTYVPSYAETSLAETANDLNRCVSLKSQISSVESQIARTTDQTALRNLQLQLTSLQTRYSDMVAAAKEQYALSQRYVNNYELKIGYSNGSYAVVILGSSITKQTTYTTYYQAAPEWYTLHYYTKGSVEVAPTWVANTYYQEVNDPPTWKANKYYYGYNGYQSNVWKAGKYYRHYVDHYYYLVEAGIDKLAELRKADTVKASLDTEEEYSIGDIVAVFETITNTNVTMKVVKKILSGTNETLKISYTLGGV